MSSLPHRYHITTLIAVLLPMGKWELNWCRSFTWSNSNICFPVFPVTLMVTCWWRSGWSSGCQSSSSIQTTLCRTCWEQGSAPLCTGNQWKCQNLERSTLSSYWVVRLYCHQLVGGCVCGGTDKNRPQQCHMLPQGFHSSHRSWCLVFFLFILFIPRSQWKVILSYWGRDDRWVNTLNTQVCL